MDKSLGDRGESNPIGTHSGTARACWGGRRSGALRDVARQGISGSRARSSTATCGVSDSDRRGPCCFRWSARRWNLREWGRSPATTAAS